MIGIRLNCILFLSLLFICISGKLWAWSLDKLIIPSRSHLLKKTQFTDQDVVLYNKNNSKTLSEKIQDLSYCKKNDIRKYLYYFLTKHKKFTIRAIFRSQRHIKEVLQILNEFDTVPKEISLLPLLESAYTPYAVSRSKAVGLWQLMFKTSMQLGLKVNYWIDERRSVEKSTIVALRHLNNLYKIFKSWELAIAAYNGGGKCVADAIRVAGKKNLWHLLAEEVLPRETHEYVPKFIALAIIYNNQVEFGIKEEIKKIPEYKKTTVVLKQPVYLNRLAKSLNISLKQIRLLNPELKRNVTPPMIHNYELIVPDKYKDVLAKNMTYVYKRKVQNRKKNKVKKYKIKSGETLIGIARKFRIQLMRIIRFNNIKRPGHIRAGKIIYIPN